MNIWQSFVKHHRKGLIGMGILVLMVAGLHFFITRKTAFLLSRLVNERSGGRYALVTESISLGWFPERVSARGIKILPVDAGDSAGSFQLELDSLHVSLRSIWPMLLHKTLNIEDITLSGPSLVLRPAGDKSPREKKEFNLHGNLRQLQTALEQVLASLNLDRFRLDNLSLKIYADNERYFLVNRVFLHIDSLQADVEANHVSDSLALKGRIHFWLDKPTLVYPDSNMSISLNHFDWDTRKRRIALDEFGFSWHKKEDSTDSIRLDLHEALVEKINWSLWANTGELQMEALSAHSGILSLALLSKPEPREKKKHRTDFISVISPLQVNRLAIREIQILANLGTRSKPAHVSMKGDSLIMESFRADTALSKPVSLRRLDLAVRSFDGRDDYGKWQTAFSSFRISKDRVTMKDFLLRADAKANPRLKNVLELPEVSILGLSIPHLLDGKIVVGEFRLKKPAISLVSSGQSKENTEPRLVIRPLKNHFGFLKINKLILEDGSFRSVDAKSEKIITESKGIYGQIYPTQLLAAGSLQELTRAFGRLGLTSFEMTTPKMKIRADSLSMNAAGHEILINHLNYKPGAEPGEVDLHSLRIRLDSLNQLAAEDKTLRVKELHIGSGRIDLQIPEQKEKTGGQNEKKKLPLFIRQAEINQLALHLKKGNLDLQTNLQYLRVDSLNSLDSSFNWQRLDAAGGPLIATDREWTARTGSITLSNQSESAIGDIRFRWQQAGSWLTLESPALRWLWPAKTLTADNLQIPFFQIIRPKLHFFEDAVGRKENQVSHTAPQTKPLRIQYDSVELSGADIVYELQNDSGRSQIHTAISSISLAGALLNRGKNSAMEISAYDLKVKAGESRFNTDEKTHVSAGAWALHLKKIFIPGGKIPASAQLNMLELDSLSFSHKAGEKNTSLNLRKIQQLDPLVIHLQKDSLVHLAYSLPPVELTGTRLILDNPKSRVYVDNLAADLKARRLSMDSFSVLNKISRDSFFADQPFEKDYITVHSGHVEIAGFDLNKNQQDTGLLIRRLGADHLFLMAERDKLRPDDTISQKPMFVGLTQKIPFPVIIDTIALQQATVWHNVIAKKTGEQGTIYFTDISGWISNARNYHYRPDDTLRIRVSSRLMGQGNLQMRFRESYMDSLQGFLITARMGPFEMPELNRILEPLILIRITKGHIDTLWLQAKANKILAFGNMEVNYRKLHVEKLDQEKKKQGFITWLANIIVRTNNEKDGTIYVERLPNKSIFNYWGRIALSGLLTNIRVASNKKYRKKYEEELLKHNLPPHLLDEDR